MIRHIALTLTAFVFAASLACDKPGVAERQREDPPSEQPRQTTNEAAQRTQSAPTTTADHDMSGVRTDFEKNREDYMHARDADLVDLDKRIAALEVKEKAAKHLAKEELQASLSAIRDKRDAFVRDMNALGKTTATGWDQAKAKVEQEWNALKAAVDKAQ